MSLERTLSQLSSYFFEPILQELGNAFRRIETKVPQPILSDRGFRYAERTIHQAIVQKLARLISGVHAVEVLLERGLFQEQGMMQRAVDEIEQDILFLSFAVINSDVTSLHKQYLEFFYLEEFADPDDVVGSRIPRGMVNRDKIRSYVHRNAVFDADDLPSANATAKTLTKAYSGYIHAASPHVMDMYFPGGFDVSGAAKRRYISHRLDARNVFYRAIAATAIVARAFGDEPLFAAIYDFAGKVDAEMRS